MKRIACVLLALFLPSLALAQDEEEQLQLLFGGGQKVSSASKGSQEEDARESAVQVTVISGEEIRAFGYHTLSEILMGAPESFSSGDNVYEVAGVRGFARDGDYNTRVLVLLDGHVLNEPWNNYTPIGTDLPIDFEQIERVEIIAGPVSALYGSNAFFGAVNIVTKKFTKTDTGVSYRAGSGNSNRATAWYDSKRIAAWATGTSTLGEPVRYPDGRSEFGTNWDQNGALGLAVTGDRASFRVTGFARRKGAIGGIYASNFGDNRSWTQDAHAFAELAVRVVDTKAIKLRIRGYGDAYKFDDFYRYDPNPVFVDHATSLWSGGEAVAEWSAGPSAFVLSLEDSYQRVTQEAREEQHPGTIAPDPDNPSNLIPIDVRRFNRARVTAQETVSFGRWGHAVGGLYVENEDLYGVQYAPRGGIVLHPWTNGTVKALYQRGFRSPSIYERFFSDADSLLTNPDLKAETVDGFDFAVGEKVGAHLELTASGFDAEYRDLILLENALEGVDNVRSSTFQQYRNGDSFRSSGATLRADWQSKLVTIRADATGFSSRDANGDPLDGVPDWLAHGTAILPVAGGRGSLAARVTGIGARPGRKAEETPVALADAALRVNRIWKDVSLIASVTNLFDSQYRNPVADEYPMTEIPQPGRRFFLEARWSYSPKP